jgi:hypothetical protein
MRGGHHARRLPKKIEQPKRESEDAWAFRPLVTQEYGDEDDAETLMELVANSGAGRNPEIPRVQGLYRIRRKDGSALEYIGETGRSLRERLGMLAGVYRATMPYRDPHTAAPALWALRHRDGCDFEASVTAVQGEDPWRKALEVTAISRRPR